MCAKILTFLSTIYSTCKYLLFGRLKLERYYNCITTTPIKDNNHYTKIKPAHERSNYPQYIYIYICILQPYRLPFKKMNDVHGNMNEQLIIILQLQKNSIYMTQLNLRLRQQQVSGSFVPRHGILSFYLYIDIPIALYDSMDSSGSMPYQRVY